MTKITKCNNCKEKIYTPDDVISFFPLCEVCERATHLKNQIYHIVGQDILISGKYKLIIHPDVFEKCKLFEMCSKKPGKYNKTHMYKEKNKYKILLQQRIFNSARDSELVFHNVDVELNDNIFWWYMEKIK